MSLLNAYMTRERALVAVDTFARDLMPAAPGGSCFEMSKMVPIVHANVMLASRGSHMIHMPVFFGLSAMQTSGFDVFAWAIMHNLLKDAVTMCKTSAVAQGAPKSWDPGDQEVYLFGWSERRQRMAGLGFFRDAGCDAWEELDVGDSWAVPWGDSWGELPYPRSLDELQSVAVEQVRRTRAEAPAIPIGGRLLVAEITRHSFTTREVCNL